MEEKKREVLILSVRKLWDSNDKVKAIDMLYETIPVEIRSEWLSRIIIQLQRLIPESEPITEVIELADKTQDWQVVRPHPILYRVRDVGVEQDDLVSKHVHLATYYLGKQIVNVKGFHAPFDHTDLFLVPQLLDEIDRLTDSDGAFLESIWVKISNAEFIQLDEPTMCNPGCVLCIQRYKKPLITQKG